MCNVLVRCETTKSHPTSWSFGKRNKYITHRTTAILHLTSLESASYRIPISGQYNGTRIKSITFSMITKNAPNLSTSRALKQPNE
jgi:hypothetical protein